MRYRHRRQAVDKGRGEEGEGEMNGGEHGSICTTICKIDSQWEFAVSHRELKPGLCKKLEGWGRVER